MSETTNDTHQVQSWTDLGAEMWSYLTGKGAAINYSFVDLEVEVPRDTGAEAPRATWKLNGTLRVTTSDDERAGSDPFRADMAPRVSIDADLRFELSPGGSAGTASGTVKGSGRHLEVYTDDPALLSGLAGSDDTARDLADALAAQHLSLSIAGPKGRIATIGAVKAPLLHRVLTRSPHIRLGKVGALLTFVRTRRGAKGRDVIGMPPGTPIPLAPTLQGWRRRRVTTTHDPLGGGRPRLVQHLSRPYMGEASPEFLLAPGLTRIGSDASMDIVLPELEPEQAHVYRTERDEYVVRNVGRPGTLVVNGAPMTQQLLRTGTRVQLGSYTFGYVRDEHADHGRPYGGRTGGETGRQRRQPPRPGADPVTDSS